MENSNFRIKAFIGFILFLYFPFGLMIDFTKYISLTTVLLIAVIMAVLGSYLILPFMKSMLKLNDYKIDKLIK